MIAVADTVERYKLSKYEVAQGRVFCPRCRAVLSRITSAGLACGKCQKEFTAASVPELSDYFVALSRREERLQDLRDVVDTLHERGSGDMARDLSDIVAISSGSKPVFPAGVIEADRILSTVEAQAAEKSETVKLAARVGVVRRLIMKGHW